MRIIEVIKKTPYYPNKIGNKIMSLVIADIVTAAKITKSYEMNFKK